MQNLLLAAKVKERVGEKGSRCYYKKATWDFEMDMFYILTVSISVSWLWYIVVLKDTIIAKINMDACYF